MSVKSSNVRLTPGVYLALKHLSEKNNLSMGIQTGFWVIVAFQQLEIMNSLPEDIRRAVVADALTILADVFKNLGASAIHDTSIADVYQQLLNPEKDEGT